MLVCLSACVYVSVCVCSSRTLWRRCATLWLAVYLSSISSISLFILLSSLFLATYSSFHPFLSLSSVVHTSSSLSSHLSLALQLSNYFFHPLPLTLHFTPSISLMQPSPSSLSLSLFPLCSSLLFSAIPPTNLCRPTGFTAQSRSPRFSRCSACPRSRCGATCVYMCVRA